MNDNTEEYRATLEGMLTEITKELSGIGIHNPENPSDWVAVPADLDTEEPDDNLQADSVENWNERSALVATLEARYNSITSALKRISEGTFGTCEICQKPIEEERLHANPASRTCIEHREDESTL